MSDKNYGRKLATKVQYCVFRKRTPNGLRYFVRKNKNKQHEVMIQKQNGAWFDGGSGNVGTGAVRFVCRDLQHDR